VTDLESARSLRGAASMELSALVRSPAMAPAARKFFEVGKHFEQVKPRQRRLFQTQPEIGGFLTEAEQRHELRPMQRNRDQRHERQHFQL
jgi:hypothetical protein